MTQLDDTVTLTSELLLVFIKQSFAGVVLHSLVLIMLLCEFIKTSLKYAILMFYYDNSIAQVFT